MTPFLQRFIDMTLFNSLSPGIVMGIMIVPLVASLSEDAMSSVPQALREGAYGLGATRMEVATRVVVPAALSGIVASIILALSRAVGETMIVAIAAGQNPTFTFDPRVPVETMTTYIVQVSLGDTPYGSLAYRTLFAVGTTLFVLTFVMNIFSFWFVRGNSVRCTTDGSNDCGAVPGAGAVSAAAGVPQTCRLGVHGHRAGGDRRRPRDARSGCWWTRSCPACRGWTGSS
ncbi:MAG: hypothetical protein KatS3mg063_2570 [Tepidiforma sp.]|nr:ABC transporter permease subunit [Tepidiforma sp.]GIW16717.1 MAG: hypothetical protein KatS3mg063_2570 [Tepidiforma sp.]